MEDNFNDTPDTEQPISDEQAEGQPVSEEQADDQPVSEEPGEEQQVDKEQPVHTQSIYQDPNADVTDNAAGLNQQDQQNYIPPQNYRQGYGQNPDTDESPLSLGDSLVLVILFAIPCVNLVVALIWAFGGTTNVNRRNLSRAQLIVWTAVLLLFILFYVVFAVTIYNGLTG